MRLGKALREAVEASPFDDAPRLVYADYLLEKGDPRGAFIQLSLTADRRPLDAREWKAFTTLLKVHERSWLGPVYDVTSSRSYRAGFLETCHLSFVTDLRLRAAASGHRVWSTVRTLSGIDAGWGADLVVNPCMRGLRRLAHLSSEGLRQLASHPTALGVESLSLDRFGRDEATLDERAGLLGTSSAFGNLKELEVGSVFHPDDMAWLRGTQLASKLEVLRLNQWPKTLPLWLDGLRHFTIRRAVDLGFGTLLRGIDGHFSDLRIRFETYGASPDDVVQALRVLPADALTALEIRGAPEAMWPTFEASAARQRRLASPVRVVGT